MSKKAFKIVWHVRKRAKQMKIKNPHQLALKTRLTYSSVLDIWNGKATGVNIVTLEILGANLNCTITELYTFKWKTTKQTPASRTL